MTVEPWMTTPCEPGFMTPDEPGVITVGKVGYWVQLSQGFEAGVGGGHQGIEHAAVLGLADCAGLNLVRTSQKPSEPLMGGVGIKPMRESISSTTRVELLLPLTISGFVGTNGKLAELQGTSQ
jgi:hypothetical protein